MNAIRAAAGEHLRYDSIVPTAHRVLMAACTWVLAGCGSRDHRDTLASDRSTAFDRNLQARNAALMAFAQQHPEARELDGQPAGHEDAHPNGDLMIEPVGCTCPGSPGCDPYALPSQHVYARPDGSVVILTVTPTVHVRYVGEICAPACGPLVDEQRLRYPVAASSKLERWDLSYPYELVVPREKPCGG
jgi:hypothetical protein